MNKIYRHNHKHLDNDTTNSSASIITGYYEAPFGVNTDPEWIAFVDPRDIVVLPHRNIFHDEWRCDYCGRVNNKKDESCKSCGAPR